MLSAWRDCVPVWSRATAVGTENGLARTLVGTPSAKGTRSYTSLMQHGRAKYAVAPDGTNIAYSVTGTGPPVLGIGDWWGHIERDWELPPLARFWTRVASYAQLILFDIRGTSLSDPISRDSTPTLDQCVEDIVAVLDAAGVDQVAVFTAASGTPLGVLFASTHPERTSSLLIYNGYVRFVSAPDQPFGLPPESMEAFKAMVLDNWGAESVILLGGPGTLWSAEDLQIAAANQRFTASPATARMLLPLLYDTDVRDRLATNDVPTVVLHAAKGPLVPVDHGRYIASVISHARFVELPGRDHYFWGEDAQQIGDELQDLVTGMHGDMEVDRVLTTLLFSDIVDSTGYAARVGDREWRRFLDDVELATRTALSHYRGVEVKSTGDGFLARFAGPGKAVQCGVALCDAVRELGAELRVGIHIGEVEVRGEDLGGIGVHIAARIQALAEPSEVLTSRTVMELVTGSGIDFTSRGPQTLRGVPGTWELFIARPRTT
jgi:class 3 adenylate cyclase